MATKYRIVQTTPKPRRRELGKYDVPVEAINLADDIVRIELAIAALTQIDTRNIGESDTQEQRDFAHYMMNTQLALLKAWQRYAKRKLATKYLAP